MTVSIACPLPETAEIPPTERVGRDRRALRRVVEEHVAEVRDQLEQIGALIVSGELDTSGSGGTGPERARFERLRDTLDGCLPALGRFLDDAGD